MVSASKCKNCGSSINSKVLEGLCPACLRRISLLCEDKMEGDGHAVFPDMGARTTTVFGEYELIEELGGGGMGMVFLARQTTINRMVALKMMRAGQFASARELRRFKAEAESAAQLQHPNIVPLYDVGEQDGRAYFTMKWIKGGTLVHWLEAQRKAGATAAALEILHQGVQILAKVARAVHHAHQRGVLHRDLKPENILLDEQGEPYVADFGIAKFLADHTTNALTVSGAVMGTLAYMAPEQAAGQKQTATISADIYSLGAVFFHLLTGRPPFAGASHLETLRQVLEEEPLRPSTLAGHLDRDLETICLKCLEKAPSQRYETALAFAEDMERWLCGEPIQARPTAGWERAMKWARRRPAMAGLSAATALSLLLGIAGIAWQSQRANSLASQATAAAERANAHAKHAERLARFNQEQVVRLHTAAGLRHVKEGDLLAALPWFLEAMKGESANSDARNTHRTRLVTTLGQAPSLAHLWFHEERVLAARFSDDGRLVITAGADKTARVWDASTGLAVSSPLVHDAPVHCVALNSDHTKLATGCEDCTAWLWDLKTGQPIAARLPVAGRGMELQAVQQVLFDAANGSFIATTRAPGFKRWNAQSGEFLEWHRSASDSLRTVIATPTAGEFVGFFVNGLVLSWRTGHEAGTRLFQAPGKIWAAQLNRQGNSVLVAMEDGKVLLWDLPAGRLIGEPFGHERAMLAAAFSPDGRRVVTGSADGTARIWDGSTGVPLTAPLEHGAAVVSVAFSSDGRWVATGSEDSLARIWKAQTGEFALPPLLHGAQLRAVQFSPGGDRLLTYGDERVVRLWNLLPHGLARMGVEGSVPWEYAVFFGDGKKLLALNSRHRDLEWIDLSDHSTEPIQARAKMELGLNIGYASLSPDGRKLAVPVLARADRPVRVFETTNGRLIGAFGMNQMEINSIAWHSDGKLLATASYASRPSSGMRTAEHRWEFHCSTKALFIGWSLAEMAAAWSPLAPMQLRGFGMFRADDWWLRPCATGIWWRAPILVRMAISWSRPPPITPPESGMLRRAKRSRRH